MDDSQKTREKLVEELQELRQRVIKLESNKVALKLAEAALKESEERLRAQYQAIPVATYTWAKKGKEFILVDMNRQGLEESGERANEFINKAASVLFHDRPDILEDLAHCYASKKVHRRETEYITRSKGEPYAAVFTFAFIEPNIVMMHSENITHRKRAEMALRESEERFRQLAEATNQVFWFTQVDPSKVLYVSPAFEGIWNIKCEDLYKQPDLWRRDILKEDLPKVEAAWKQCVSGKKRDYVAEYRLKTAHNGVRWILDSGIAITNEDGQVYRISGIARDITERRQAVDKLRESELFFRTVANHIYHWEYWRGLDGRFIYVSPSCERITGYAPEDFLQEPELLDSIIEASDQELFRKHRNIKKLPGKIYKVAFTIRTKNGEFRRIHQWSQAVHDPERGFLGIRASNVEEEGFSMGESEK